MQKEKKGENKIENIWQFTNFFSENSFSKFRPDFNFNLPPEKNEELILKIKETISGITLFDSLEYNGKEIIIRALQEQKFLYFNY